MLKAEVARRHPDWKPAYMRPQLVTWKCEEEVDVRLEWASPFARVAGISFGLHDGPESMAPQAEAFAETPVHLHVYPRVVPEDGFSKEEWNALDARRANLIAALAAQGWRFHPSMRAVEEGDLVLDVILCGANAADDGGKLLFGAHRHAWDRHPAPGSVPRMVVPAEAPSRAYLKMEQALAWVGLDGERSLAGRTALELGCAPGGASYAMLRHGARVMGVDTAPVDEVVREFKVEGKRRFRQLEIPVGALAYEELPNIDLLASDMNLAPAVALRYIEPLQQRLHAKLLILTLKLNDAEVERGIPALLGRIKGFAPGPLRAVQLPGNRREFCVMAGGL